MEKNNEQRKISAERVAVYVRNYQRARSRALTKLSNLHPDTYKQLLEQERKADEEKGKKWLDINGTTLVPSADNERSDSAHANS